MDTSVYLAQCMSGHVLEVIAGTKLEQKCRERAAKGLLDALCLGPGECPECSEEDREHERRNANMCADAGCMFMSLGDKEHPCNNACMAQRTFDGIENSPYKGQLRGLPANA